MPKPRRLNKPDIAMEDYQKAFIELAIEKQVLRFGEFRLKSGRLSPYFFDNGRFNDGQSLAARGGFYAAAIRRARLRFDMIYGPAYKGIPLAAALAITFQKQDQTSYPFCCSRKEVKDHGEGGQTFGRAIGGRVLIIDDVISAGTAILEAVNIIRRHGGRAVAAAVAIDRQERGQGACSATQEVAQNHDLKVVSIIGLDQIIGYLAGRGGMRAELDAMRAYRAEYGIDPQTGKA